MAAIADRFGEAADDIANYEMAQLGDLHWAESTLRDHAPQEAACRQADIDALAAKVKAGLSRIVEAANTRDEPKLDAAVAAQGALGHEIDDLLVGLARAVPAVLDSDWVLPPALREMKNTRDRSTP